MTILQRMKEEASKENNAIVFNAINSYQKDKDVTVLIETIKFLNKQNKKYEQALYQCSELEGLNKIAKDALGLF